MGEGAGREAAGAPSQGGAPDRQPSPSNRGFGRVTEALNVLGTLFIVALTTLTNADIIGRDFFNRPVPGVPEIVALSIVVIVFLQMSHTLRQDRHIVSDVLMTAMKPRWPRLARCFYALYNLIGAVLMGLIVWYTIPILRDAWVNNFYRGTEGVVKIPTWPVHLVVVVGAAATAIQYLIFFARDLRLLGKKR